MQVRPSDHAVDRAVDLKASQQRFAQALLDAAQVEPATALLAGDTAVLQRRLGIYRGNVVAAISKTLALIYPVIQQLVGEEFFGGLARACWQQSPSCSGNLHEYGADFADFLAAFPHTQNYPYLPDVARLEWAAHCAASAADPQHFNPAVLADLPEEQWPDLRFHFTPGFALLPSAHPVVQIWTLHQANDQREGDDAFTVDWGQAQTALVYRNGMRVQVIAVDTAQAAALNAMISGQTLSDALDAAYAIQEDFDIQGALSLWISSGWISSVE